MAQRPPPLVLQGAPPPTLPAAGGAGSGDVAPAALNASMFMLELPGGQRTGLVLVGGADTLHGTIRVAAIEPTGSAAHTDVKKKKKKKKKRKKKGKRKKERKRKRMF